MTEHFDVLVVGAGISGVGAGYHLKTRASDRSFAILEGRDRIGGTWDLFRYPGVRSDSDMHTLGYAFRPWTGAKAIADGPAIRRYVEDTAREFGIDRHIRFGHRVRDARWSTSDARWTLTVDRNGAEEACQLSCNFLMLCSGYYDYARGHAPDFAGAGDFAGRIVHPQFWPADLDYTGKRVVVIGSGATAVTLVPELAKRAADVTMLQRSPSYIVARPAQDRIANKLRAWLPERLAYGITRWKNVIGGQLFFRLARARPAGVKRRIVGWARDRLGTDYDIARHFTPHYDPWDQRMCLAPDGDLFETIRAGRARVVTDRIDRFTRDGICLESGEHVPADIIVTATGLEMRLMGGIDLSVDGEPVRIGEHYNYKGVMFSDIPNLAATFGYTAASWTLKIDLTCMWVCRLLNRMKARGMRQATPRIAGGDAGNAPLIDFSSGYIARAQGRLPRQGTRAPWRLNQNYLLDLIALRFGSVEREIALSNPETVPTAAPRDAAPQHQ